MRDPCVYILTNRHHTTLYIGVTNDLQRRLYEHKANQGYFTAKYRLKKLVYYESHSRIETAILREKQIKRWSRSKKEWLVETVNPSWDDLSL